MMHYCAADRGIAPRGEAYLADCVEFRVLDAFDNDLATAFDRHVAAFEAIFGRLPACVATEIEWFDVVVEEHQARISSVAVPRDWPFDDGVGWI